MEQTLVLVKGDGVRRKLVGEIIRRIEARGLDIVDMKLMVVAMRIGGEGAIKAMRTLMGATNPADAAPGTIRGDLALSMPDNLVHGSDSPESAERELGLFFGP